MCIILGNTDKWLHKAENYKYCKKEYSKLLDLVILIYKHVIPAYRLYITCINMQVVIDKWLLVHM